MLAMSMMKQVYTWMMDYRNICAKIKNKYSKSSLKATLLLA